ncbi:MAG: type II toxin-antitoxin system HicA family toxin [Armatimonadetes bacterium]|nr:type II toxin-antitoxin system HicA family toxin [Armatimonadota bacterium]
MDNNAHRKLILYVNDKRTSVWTEVSHDGKTVYTRDLLLLVKRELKLHTMQQVRDLVDCPMTYEGYVSLLREGGIIA